MKKKKVCIATWYGPANYGTGLQAVSLKKYLESNEYEAFFVEDLRKKEKNTSKFKKLQDKIKQIITLQFFYKRKYINDIRIKNEMQEKFIKDFDKVFKIKSNEDIKELNEITDIFVSGSDQIWNPYVFNEVNMLSIADDDKKKISYASSVGVKHIPQELKEHYKKLLNRYSKISVREKQSKEALIEFLDKNVAEVLDPTLLLNASEWEFLINSAEIDSNIIPQKYILCYFVGKRKSYWKYVEKMRKKTGYDIIVLPINNEGFVNKYNKYVKATPKEFLWLIKNAAIVCTDSFHATLFSIQFKREFYVLKRFKDNSSKSQNGRLINILRKLGLENRLINDEKKFNCISINDYDDALNKLEEERKKSQEWLIKAIKE